MTSIVFLIFFYGVFVICIEEATDSCVLILNPTTLLGVFIRCKSLLVES